MKTSWFYTLALHLAMIPASAQLLVGSLKPAGGETFQVGATMSIEWVAAKAQDGRYDIYSSKDGGKTFPLEMAGPWQGSKVDGAKNTYLWKIPATSASNQVRIRICQLYGGHCTQPGVYTMDSPADFIITTATGLSPADQAGMAEPRLDFVADDRNLSVSFTLPEAGNVSLKAFEVSGHLLATVAQGILEKGDHRFAVFSDRLDFKGPVIFKLERTGQEAITQIWNGL